MTASDWREAIDEFDSIDDAAAGAGEAGDRGAMLLN